ncbi:MAG: topoisomerase DNA-binding C4 zinc finger domain-containing protein [Lachnospiraceae bacterium]|nr:topoisomerase DNA-binding C4 zinc finger domain-containing protein [Lachnospiraceae bacterium]
MLGNKRGKRLTYYVPDYVVFDLETTGISPKRDKVIEISAVKVKEGKVVDEFSSLVNPLCSIPYGASQVNNITDDMVEDAPVFEEVLPQFIEFIEELPLVGHNIHSFDMNFIYRDSRDMLGEIPDNDYIDTLHISRSVLPDMAHHRMTDLAAHYGVSTAGAHRALADCHMTQKVFEGLHNDMESAKLGNKQVRICPKCNSVLKLRNGIYGEFYGCVGYPECRYTENVS